MSSPTVEYKFKNQGDLAFYILNAVCHDWIHDFNNYERMSKILEYINNLVNLTNTKEDEPKTIEMTTEEGVYESKNSEPLGGLTGGTEPMSVSTEEDEEKEYKFMLDSQSEQYLDNEYLDNDYNFNDKLKKYFNYRYTHFDDELVKLKINIFQNIEDFIGETKLLVISRLLNISIDISIEQDKAPIKYITDNDILNAINEIIQEINEKIIFSDYDEIRKTYMYNLVYILQVMSILFLNLKIEDISPLEKFNNSIISEIISIFIVNNFVSINIEDIENETLFYLNFFVSSMHSSENSHELAEPLEHQETKSHELFTPPINKESKQSSFQPKQKKIVKGTRSYKSNFRNIKNPKYVSLSTLRGRNILKSFKSRVFPLGGGSFNAKKYQENRDNFGRLDQEIIRIKSSTSVLYRIYNGQLNISSLYDDTINALYQEYAYFINFISADPNLAILITGINMYKVKTNQIKKQYDLLSSARQRRNRIKYLQQLIDTINDFIFDKIINPYEDLKSKFQAKVEESDNKLGLTQRNTVQQISQLVASKTLELMEINDQDLRANQDLSAQFRILEDVLVNNKYTSVDTELLKYFKSKVEENIRTINTVEFFENFFKGICNDTTNNCRVINNAIPIIFKEQIDDFVKCPTSSVCDGMGSFGSCSNYTQNQKEFYDMDFAIYENENAENYYQGMTRIKNKQKFVSVQYGFKFNKLQMYNFLDIDISEQPIILQANYTFKGVINRIIEIWKGNTATEATTLWDILYNTDLFLSILKLGSQKAIGDIFQEINSTLVNGGYSYSGGVKSEISNSITWGLMGDRPSGIRVLKLLKDSSAGKNNNAIGGYIGSETSLLYFPDNFPPITTGGISRKRKLEKCNRYTLKKNKYNKKKNKYIKNINKSVKKQKSKNKRTKKIK